MVVVNFESPKEFVIEEAFTYGVENSKYGGYSVPLKLQPDDGILKLLKTTAEENKAVLKLYGSDKTTIYIQFDQLTDKQGEELLNKRKMIVLIEFSATGTYVGKDGITYLKLELTRLRKIRVPERVLKPAPKD